MPSGPWDKLPGHPVPFITWALNAKGVLCVPCSVDTEQGPPPALVLGALVVIAVIVVLAGAGPLGPTKFFCAPQLM
jgi:hypothetical protein